MEGVTRKVICKTDEKKLRTVLYEESKYEGPDGHRYAFQRGFSIDRKGIRLWVRRTRDGKLMVGSFHADDRDHMAEVLAGMLEKSEITQIAERTLRSNFLVPDTVDGLVEVIEYIRAGQIAGRKSCKRT